MSALQEWEWCKKPLSENQSNNDADDEIKTNCIQGDSYMHINYVEK